MSAILLRGITILPMTRPEGLLLQGDLLVRDGRIAYLGPHLEQLGEGLEIFDGAGKVALPGLVNSHTHLAMTFLRGFADDMSLHEWLISRIWPQEAKLQGEQVYHFSLLGTLELIGAGITTFADMYYFAASTARAVEESGLRATLAQGVIGLGSPDPRTSFHESLKFAQKYRGSAGGRIQTMLAPHAVYTCSTDLLRQVGEVARDEGFGVHIHLSETESEVRDSLAHHGMTPPQLLDDIGLLDTPLLAAHCVALREEDYPILARAQGIASCPTSNLKLASGIPQLARMADAGLPLALGTDGASANNRLDLLAETKLAAILAKGASGNPQSLPAFQALQMATLGGAKALGLAERIGTLEVGKQADIAIFDFQVPHLQPCYDYYSHLVYAALASDVHSVMVDGRWLYRDRQYQTLDRDAVLQQAAKSIGEVIG